MFDPFIEVLFSHAEVRVAEKRAEIGKQFGQILHNVRADLYQHVAEVDAHFCILFVFGVVKHVGRDVDG